MIVGWVVTASGQSHATRWDPDGRVVELPSEGAQVSWPVGLNARGEVAGYLGLSTLSPEVRPARWDVRGQVVVGEAPAGNTAFAIGINNRGTTIGNTGLVTRTRCGGTVPAW